MALFQLPPEVWLHVFGYLTEADKFAVRTCCRYFKKLVDHRSLWRDCIVVLRFQNGAYNPQFWATLRRRKISAVVVQSAKAKHWKQLALSLPALTAIVMDQVSQDSVDLLKGFTDLKRVAIRGSVGPPLLIDSSTVAQPQQLTHLSLCDVNFPSPVKDTLIASISKFTNLTSLVYHHKGKHKDPVGMFYSIIKCLPKMKHLSWSVNRTHPVLHHRGHNYFDASPVGTDGYPSAVALSSLELVDYVDPSLSADIMTFLPCLQSLAVFYQHSYEETSQTRPQDASHLKTWLKDLRQLSTLVIVNGPPLKKYATSIPATVTSLSLRVRHSAAEMAAVAVTLPSLLHLHFDPWPSFLGARTGEIPDLYPNLKSLKLRHEHVPKKDFLRLYALQKLRHLEILDAPADFGPYLCELICKLQALSKYRIQVTPSPRQEDLVACLCICQLH